MRRLFPKIQLITCFLIFFAILSNTEEANAQTSPANSTEIYRALKKLNVLGSVLYIAAHPDDENTSVLSYMAQGKLVRTAYLSFTRGDGGQNLLGNEKGALLGVIRTQELLSARLIDGAEQFFSRAIDFGYSKTADETLHNWDREKILLDVVRVIRNFRPDVILTRFSETNGGHGHHLVSAILAKEAFHAAADPSRFHGQLQELETWQAKRILWNTWRPSSEALSINVGTYNPLLGQSYQEFAAASRSMHKSQGFGVSPGRGSQLVYFDHTAGDTAKYDLFDKIDISWNRVPGTNKIQHLINQTIQKFNPENPADIVPDLVKIFQLLEQHSGHYWINIKKREIQDIIRICSGLWLESIVWKPGISPDEDIDVRSMVVNRSKVPIILNKLRVTYLPEDTLLKKDMEENKPLSIKQTVHIPENAPYSQPFWLEETNNGKMFSLSSDRLIDLAESPSALVTQFFLEISGHSFIYEIPVQYRWTDPIKGAQFRPFVIRPKLSISIDKPTYVFTGTSTHEIKVQLLATGDNVDGQLMLTSPQGWTVQPKVITFSLEESGDQVVYSFQVTPGPNAENGEAYLKAIVNGKVYNNEIIEIEYDHIPLQTLLQPAHTRLINLDINILPGRIGYIMGSGDDIPEALIQLGYRVDLLSDENLNKNDLSIYDAIICGIRAFNTREQLGRQQKRLIQYVEDGGTWIVQHNTRFGTKVEQIGPYPFTTSGRDRISEENAPIQILIPEHPVFNHPNIITARDFEGWVQERGLYFADNWQGKLYPLLAGNDKNEPSKLGGLLYARYGKGIFIFTAYSLFRQLPAGVPGAYRLFVNLISAKGKY